MKKVGILSLFVVSVLLCLALFSFVLAQEDMPSLPGSGSGAEGDKEAIEERIQKGKDIFPFDPETGEFKKTEAEKRIAAIDKWLNDNVSWLELIFGMKPEVSWLFAINFLIMLTLLNALVMNGIVIRVPVNLLILVGIVKSKTIVEIKKYHVPRIIGLIIFIFLLETRFIMNVLARPTALLWSVWWGQLIIVIALIVLQPLLNIFYKYVGDSFEEKIKEGRQSSSEEKEKKLKEDIEDIKKSQKSIHDALSSE